MAAVEVKHTGFLIQVAEQVCFKFQVWTYREPKSSSEEFPKKSLQKKKKEISKVLNLLMVIAHKARNDYQLLTVDDPCSNDWTSGWPMQLRHVAHAGDLPTLLKDINCTSKAGFIDFILPQTI